MKILVLGGAGYIGSHTVYRLIESGNEVVVVDNLETGHIEAVHPKAKFYKGDLRNRSEIDSVFDKEKGRYTLPQLFVSTNGVILTEEIGYLPNLGGVQLGFIHYVFQISVPCAVLFALCVIGIISAIQPMNLPLLILLSACSLVIIGFAVVMLYRGSKMKKSVENIILLQIRKLRNNS